MPDYHIDWCPKCGGRAEIKIENGSYLFRCDKCGLSVVICREDEVTTEENGRLIVLPASSFSSIDQWNTKEDVNGR